MNHDTDPDDSDSDDSQGEEPKIIVDSDWKEQVNREKDQAAPAAAPTPEKASQPTNDSSSPLPPPASFDVLVSMLFSQAMTLLGQIPDPSSDEVSINKPYAKHYIDTLEMLSEKTQGNLSDDESGMLSEVLHVLRMTYVNVKSP
jgi:hypothetical protein